MSRLARVDFRANSLTGTGGFDSLAGANSGNIAVTSTDPGVGLYAADWTSDSDAYGVVEWTAASTVHAHMYLILDAAPASSLTVLQLLNGGTVVGEINIETDRTLLLKNNNTQIGSASSALTLGTLYRIGIKQVKGTGANAELYGYLATQHQDFGAAFASATNQSFTTDCDELRAGAVDAVALDARIGFIEADNLLMPGSWLDKHDIIVDSIGLMRVPNTQIVEGDLTPAYDRAAIGEKQHDTFATMSFAAMANWGGGVGQSRLVSADKFLTGIMDGRFPGFAFPPRKAQAHAQGGGNSWYFNRGTTLYQFNGSTIDQVNSASAFAGNAAPGQKPIVDGNNNAWWVGSGTVQKFNGATTTAVTPSGYIPLHISRYGRTIFLFATTTIPNHAYVGQKINDFSGLSGSVSKSVGRSSMAYAVVTVRALTTAPGISNVDPTWGAVGSANIGEVAVYVYGKHFPTGGSASFDVTLDAATSSPSKIAIFEIAGVDPNSPTAGFSGGISPSADGAGSVASGTIATATNGVRLGGVVVNDGANLAEASMTEISEDGGADIDNAFYRNTTETNATYTVSTTATDKACFLLCSTPHPSAGQTVMDVLTTFDGGGSWIAAPGVDSPQIYGTFRASHAAGGHLWFTTDRGLWKMVAQESQTVDGEIILLVSITGEHDTWDVPLNNTAGNWLTSFEGLLYYPVGGTIRRYAPGADEGTIIWPPSDWGTVAGKVQAVVSGEGGLWFGAAGYLWNFNGRGFQQMAAEPTANDFDYLHWHQGNLYFNTDPSGYFEFGYPAVRPDILINQSILTAADFDTGYLITSSLDFEKAADAKTVRLFESRVSFTNPTDTGTVAYHYRVGGTGADPGLAGGGDTGSTWTSIGTHAFADGGYKSFQFDPELEAYEVWVRATLTPGTSGIPRLHYFTVWGQSVMPQVSQFMAQVQVHSGQLDREGNHIYDSVEQVQAVILALKTKRAIKTPNVAGAPLARTIFYKDGTDGGEVVKATFAQLEFFDETKGEDGKQYHAQATIRFEELPK